MPNNSPIGSPTTPVLLDYGEHGPLSWAGVKSVSSEHPLTTLGFFEENLVFPPPIYDSSNALLGTRKVISPMLMDTGELVTPLPTSASQKTSPATGTAIYRVMMEANEAKCTAIQKEDGTTNSPTVLKDFDCRDIASPMNPADIVAANSGVLSTEYIDNFKGRGLSLSTHEKTGNDGGGPWEKLVAARSTMKVSGSHRVNRVRSRNAGEAVWNRRIRHRPNPPTTANTAVDEKGADNMAAVDATRVSAPTATNMDKAVRVTHDPKPVAQGYKSELEPVSNPMEVDSVQEVATIVQGVVSEIIDNVGKDISERAHNLDGVAPVHDIGELIDAIIGTKSHKVHSGEVKGGLGITSDSSMVVEIVSSDAREIDLGKVKGGLGTPFDGASNAVENVRLVGSCNNQDPVPDSS